MENTTTGERGQSLIGILVVVAVGILIAWFFLGESHWMTDNGSTANQSIQSGREVQSKQDLRTLRQAINRYRTKTGDYPPDLRTLVDEGYVSGGALKDPHGNRYRYNPQTGSVGE